VIIHGTEAAHTNIGFMRGMFPPAARFALAASRVLSNSSPQIPSATALHADCEENGQRPLMYVGNSWRMSSPAAIFSDKSSNAT
jgi:hypothetical protein